MDAELIYSGAATLAELYELNELGYEFVVERGKITQIEKHGNN